MEMASSVIFEERVEIPYFRSLAEFRAWALSDDFPQRGRIDYIGGRIEVDMSPENVFFHGSVKTEVVGALAAIVKSAGGYLFSDCTRVSSPDADLSAEPDIVYLSDDALDGGRVRLVPSASGEPDSFVELEGAPDLVVEIVSDSSVAKDTKRLPPAYWRAGIAEYWLIDVRGERLVFRIHAGGTDGYEPMLMDADGFQRSEAFDCRFRLDRRRNARGRWVFDLQSRECEG
jgi:Uma2 family endonuclease